jgi:hypothetical protein
MKRNTFSLTLLAVVLALALSAFAAAVLYQDNFATMDPAWGMPSASLYVKDGKFVIAPPVNKYQVAINAANILPNDMDASVGLTYQKVGDPDYASGMIFWAKDTSDYYVIAFSPDGWFAIQRYAGGRMLAPVPWREVGSAKKGVNVENILRVVTKGNQATAYINGKQIVTFSGQPPQGGSLVGLKGSSGPNGVTAAAFANLKVVGP